MTQEIKIALDVMGGDHGPSTVLEGADLSCKRYPEIRYILHGEPDQVLPELNKFENLQSKSDFKPCDVSIAMTDKPSQALRRGRWRSSMWNALEDVKETRAAVMVSAGNTGALMAMSKFCLRMMPGVERPALAAVWPHLYGESIVLDVGANIGADSDQLVDYALMGSAMSRSLFSHDEPTVALLNIGSEEMKGLEEIREAGRKLKKNNLSSLRYVGFVEGNDLGQGIADVIVTEGFTGNIALKSAEGTARQFRQNLYHEMSRTLVLKIGSFFVKSAFQKLQTKMDPRKMNGGVFLGLNGIVIKSHGGTDSEGIASAIDVGRNMAANQLQKKIAYDLDQAKFDVIEPQKAI
ncbi:phosphate acyltransferase PlsX [Candidatus Endowatersipora endosymbiont of Watersipora subatra]|uniref:phosphate acyltransferase PlsX n=1 Tax=Candidatus Endowatersipora endosymbiont of Watersipora subatra TaxID=3077946 RepID=UPI00312C6FEC